MLKLTLKLFFRTKYFLRVKIFAVWFFVFSFFVFSSFFHLIPSFLYHGCFLVIIILCTIIRTYPMSFLRHRQGRRVDSYGPGLHRSHRCVYVCRLWYQASFGGHCRSRNLCHMWYSASRRCHLRVLCLVCSSGHRRGVTGVLQRVRAHHQAQLRQSV